MSGRVALLSLVLDILSAKCMAEWRGLLVKVAANQARLLLCLLFVPCGTAARWHRLGVGLAIC